jgi:RNA recognition motif-containing protein
VKKTFWQKIVSFFVPNGKSAASPAREHVRPAPREDRGDRPDRGERPERPARSERPVYEPRKPEAVEVTSPKLYVGNLSFDAAENDLAELFNGVGKVQTVELVTHKLTEKSKGFAFVIMTSIDEAQRAVVELHDKEFMGRKLVVSGAKTPGA